MRGKWLLPLVTAALAFSLWNPAQAHAAEGVADDGVSSCLECHGKPDEFMVREGQKRSIHVDALTYQESVHGILPCIRCHAEAGPEHEKDPDVPLNLPTGRELRALMADRCVKCHAGLYEQSYLQSFHGIAVENGDLRGATCVDCHGIHDIFSSDDTRATTAPANLAASCGAAGCHVNPPASFADGKEHFDVQNKASAGALYWVWKFFIGLILFDVMKDGPIVMFELLRRLRG